MAVVVVVGSCRSWLRAAQRWDLRGDLRGDDEVGEQATVVGEVTQRLHLARLAQ